MYAFVVVVEAAGVQQHTVSPSIPRDSSILY